MIFKIQSKLAIIFSLIILNGIAAFGQQYSQSSKPRSILYLGIYGGIGFSTLHKEEINYQKYESGSWVDRKTIASPYFSYGFGIFSDVYIDSLKTFGFSIDVSFSRMGYQDRIYEEYFRSYYIIFAPKIISWTKKNFFVAAGWYYAILLNTTKDSSTTLFEDWDHGIIVDWGFNQESKNVLTRTGFKIYIGLKKVFKKWDINLDRRGDPEGYNFTVHFYISFVFSLI